MARRLPLRTQTPPAILLIVGALFLVFAFAKGLQHYSFKTNDYDTGIYSNLAWNIAHGYGFHSSILQKNHLGEHFSPIMAAFAPMYWAWPNALVLLLAQALAVSLTFLILWWICGEVFADLPPRQRIWLSAGILLLFFLYRPMLSALWFQFHPSTLAMPLVAGAILCLHRGSRMPLILLIGLLLLTKENAPASVLGLALYAAAVLDRKKTAINLAIASAVSAVLILFLLMPLFRDNAWGHLSRFGPFDNPGEKFGYLIRLILPLGLLPLFGWQALLAALPLTCINLSANLDLQWSMKFHYDDQNSVFWIVAAAHGAKRLNAWLASHPAPRLISHYSKLAIPFLILVLAFAFRGRSPLREIGRCWPTADIVQTHAILAKYTDLPYSDPVAAQSGLGPHLCNRFTYRSIKGKLIHSTFKLGTYILLSPVAGAFNMDLPRARQFLRSASRAIPVENSALLQVYRWDEPVRGKKDRR